MTYTLHHNGQPLETHSTRDAALMAAFSHGLVVLVGGKTRLVEGAEIVGTENVRRWK